ncbi:MAG: hypothetical protein KJ711_00155, partial [Candidatus Omnitrophica bacterium]|nr:hypothetical protein [Candidatus Omnitrophota bacterium]MBU1523223.1 hypothetical protein [Candidatus Omnitrophota bacterium]
TVFEVKSGRVKKFPGDFNYYWQRVKDSTFFTEHLLENSAVSQEVSSTKRKKQYLEFNEGDRGARKSHNAKLAKKIKELRKEKEKEEIQRYAKRRVLSNPYSVRSEEITKEYSRCLKEIEEKILKIDKEIKKLEQSFFPE